MLHLLRTKWPQAQISWLVTPGCASLIDTNPDLNNVILFDRKHYGHAWRKWSATKGFLQFCKSLRAESFDLVIDLQGLFRSGWLAWQSGAKLRIGLSNAREFATVFYTHSVKVSWDQHAVDRNLAVADALGCGQTPVTFNFATTQADHQKIQHLISAGQPSTPSTPSTGPGDNAAEPLKYAVLIPGTNWATKRWPIRHFVDAAKRINDELGLQIVVAGSSDEAALGAQIPGVNLCGKTNLRELVALLDSAALVIANDSGPMHIAAALGKPLVTLFGPTNPARTGPYQRAECVIDLKLPCSPCYSRKCSHQSCLNWLEPDQVIRKSVELTVKGSATFPKPLDS